MRQKICLNQGWFFGKAEGALPETLPEGWMQVCLPHTWNARDGQDGGDDYLRAKHLYIRSLRLNELPKADCCYLEVKGANASADVYLNGAHLAHHDGGYATWRVDLTDHLLPENLLIIAVDNSPNDHVYPQMADFTFYGGLYRDVNLILVPRAHFDLDTCGAPGLRVTPEVQGQEGQVRVETKVTRLLPKHRLHYVLADASGRTVAEAITDQTSVCLTIPEVHLWQGRRDPYLYTCTATLLSGEATLDEVSVRFGFRSFRIDPERGFLLNGSEYPLRGVARHQDWKGIGNALLPEHHQRDIDLICEMGANAVRLAHYQHDQYFYDLCDERGLVVWAEIPYISQHLPHGMENTRQQMTELILQNCHHPSIVVWGLSNEITMRGAEDPALLENHRMLNDLAHRLDPSRPTTLAVLSSCPADSAYLRIPDTIAYNHYFGWYGGDTSMYGPWLDDFHARYPRLPIGISEYGCEALNWHTSDPRPGDYTEEYQAYYHEELIRQLFSRPYLWATFVWNMFDFGADARCEGGEDGQNHKGLVTFDRQYKKDAFYAYKAWLSDEPFVHLCGKRYVDRAEEVTRVTVYSNQPEVELLVNGRSQGRRTAPDHFFYFDVPCAGEMVLEARAGGQQDTCRIRRTAQFNEAYRLKDPHAVLNWFDITAPEGYLSLNDSVRDVMAVPEGRQLFTSLLREKLPQTGTNPAAIEPAALENMLGAMDSFTLLRLMGMLSSMKIHLTKEELLAFNAALNQVRKAASGSGKK